MTAARFRFSSDPAEMDRPTIIRWLAEESYWAQGRTAERHSIAMESSLNFGMFDTETGAQVAYARVITDRVTFAWLCDVFVSEDARGQGVGVAFIEQICAVLDPMNLKRVGLTTADAHGLYEKFGFGPIPKPETWMAKVAG
jgi:GNAT superfamily N-acetyltransferase